MPKRRNTNNYENTIWGEENHKNKLEQYKENSELLKIQDFFIKNKILKTLSAEEINEILEKRAIIFDIYAEQKDNKPVLKMPTSYGLDMSIKNIDSFINFCKMHWLYPMIDKIYIENTEITQLKELYGIITCAIRHNDYWVMRILFQEVEKIKNTNNLLSKKVLEVIDKTQQYTELEYQDLLWSKIQKTKNLWVISENVFVELALRMENEIRDLLGIRSTYIQLASFKDDTEKKKDMEFILRKESSQHFQKIPIQFTIGGDRLIEKKEEQIEEMIFNDLREKPEYREYNNFCILAVNWKFKEACHDKGIIVKKYQEWINNPSIREENISWNHFPFFIDRIDNEILEPAKVMYIALHLLYKKYSFKNSTSNNYLRALEKNGKLHKTDSTTIEWIDTGDIYLDNVSVTKKTRRINKDQEKSIQKYICNVVYQGEKCWEITIFSL